MAKIALQQPPRTRGVFGLITALVLVGWTAWLLTTYQRPPPAPVKNPVETAPSYVEIDLRGPQYDAGRYEGFQRGKEAVNRGFTAPAEKVLAFQAGEAAKLARLDATQAKDFSDGYQSGYLQALAAGTEAKVRSASSQK